MSNKKCYWFSENRCQLETLPCDYVYHILLRVPHARLAIKNNTCSSCDIDPKYIDFMTKHGFIVDPHTCSDHIQKAFQPPNYIDIHRVLPGGPKVPGDGSDT